MIYPVVCKYQLKGLIRFSFLFYNHKLDWTIKISPILDHSLANPSQLTCFKLVFKLVLQVNKSGWKFILKPLTQSAWIALFVTCLILLSFDFVAIKMGSQHKISHNLIILFGGVSLTIVISFYSGAQTMFLASDMEAPFSTILDGLKYHPDWTFVLPYGDENIFINLFAHLFNDSDMGEKFKRAEEFRREPVQIDEAFDLLNKGKYYMLTSPNRVTSMIDDNSLSSLSVFCDDSKMSHSYIVPKNSPFKQAINRGLTRMRNIGVLQMLIRKLRSKEEQTKFASAKQSNRGIDFQQVSLMFYIGGAVVILVVMLVVCEKSLYTYAYKQPNKIST